MGPANENRAVGAGQGSGAQGAQERTEREIDALTARLEQARRQESIGWLSSVMARDVNALLSSLIEQLGLIGAPWDADACHAVAGATAAALRAEKMVREIGALGRDLGRESREIDPRELIRGLRDLLGRRLGDRVLLLVDADEPVGTIQADPEQIEQVILDLVANASASMPGGGTVELRLRSAEVDTVAGDEPRQEAREPFVVLEVIDTGAGLDDGAAADLLARGAAARDEAPLDLALVRGIVRHHGGFIHVRSRRGEGSSCAVFLPRFAEPDASQPGWGGHAGAGREAPSVIAG